MAGNTLSVESRPEKRQPVEVPSSDPEGSPISHDGDSICAGEDDYPEGGRQAWLSVLGSFLVYFASFGVVNSFGFFQTFYQHEYLSDYAPSTISFIGTLQISLLTLSGSVAGALFDLYGPKVTIGGSGSMLATSFTQPNAIWQQFLAQSLLFGFTVAYGVQPALTIAGQYFHRRRGLAMGIVASGSSLGGTCLPIMFSKLIPVTTLTIPAIGFPWAMRVGALVLLVCYAVAILVSSSRQPRRKLKSAGELLDYKGFLDVRYTCLAIGATLISLGVYVPLYYIEPYCAILDPNSKIQAYLLPLINASSLFGRVIGGFVADRIGRLNFLYPMMLLCGILCLAMWLPATSPGVLVGFACPYGFASGVFFSVMSAATGQIVPTEKLGARLGAFGTVTAAAFLTGTPIAGALIRSETREGYQPLIIFGGCTMLGGGLVLLIGRVLHDRNLRSKW